MAASKKVTLTAATAKLIATGGVGSKVLIKSALTDIYIGDSTVTSDGAASYGALAAGVNGPYDIVGDLWAISATGGTIYLYSADAAL